MSTRDAGLLLVEDGASAIAAMSRMLAECADRLATSGEDAPQLAPTQHA